MGVQGRESEVDAALLQVAASQAGFLGARVRDGLCEACFAHEDLGLDASALLGRGLAQALDARLLETLDGGGFGPLRGHLRAHGRVFELSGHLGPLGAGALLTAQVEDARGGFERRLSALTRSLAPAPFALAVARGAPPFEVLYVNPAFEAYTGRTLEEVRGGDLRVLQGADRGQLEARRIIREALETGGACQVELRNYTKGGALYHNQVTILPVWGNGERPELFLGLQRDVSAEHRARAAIARERELLAEAERVARCATWQWDVESREVLWSPGIYTIVERPPELLPVSFEDHRTIYGDDFEPLFAAVERCVEEGRPYELDLRVHRPSGILWAHARGRRIRDEAGRTRLVGVLQDIDERKRYEEALEHTAEALIAARDRAEAADRAKSQFLANMSHELRTPMNGVVGAASLIREASLDAESRELLRTIRSSGETLLTIINDILDLSKVEAGEMSLEALRFDVEDLLEEAILTFAPVGHEKGLTIELEAEVPGTAVGDPIRIRQILLNLLGNAVKFTKAGWVRLRAAPSGPGRWRFEVRDTGIGIPEEVQPRLFQPFAQADASTARRFGGTGLGLTISRRLARLMGGDLTFESAFGNGSCFTLELPLEAPEPRPADRSLGGLKVVIDRGADGRGEGRAALARAARLLREAGALVLSDRAEAAERFSGPWAPPSVSAADVVLRWARRDGPGERSGVAGSNGPDDPDRAARTVHLWPGAVPSDASSPGVHLSSPVRRSALVEGCLAALGRARPAPAAADEPPPALRVLLVDDNAVNRKVAGKMLERIGVEWTAVDGGPAAVEACARSAYDLVLMDIQMPEMDGYEATRRIRQLEAGPHRASIVALTASALPSERADAEAAGMDGFLAKPVRLEDLRDVLTRAARARRA